MKEVTGLIFAGVGGQGSLLIAEITSIAAVQAGFDVKQTEVHGVSQRGGSVETHVRFGEKVFSPVVTPGEADAIIALEKLEALRFAHFVNRKGGVILVNDYEIVPGSVLGAAEKYPHEVIEYLREKSLSVIPLPASRVARDLGDGRMANVVMIGALSPFLPIPEASWQKALHVRLPARYLEGNLSAFSSGKTICEELLGTPDGRNLARDIGESHGLNL
jgi:indolepyruvate ferredoxin oxidoreductase beta subunit